MDKKFKIIVKNKSDENLYIQFAKLIGEKINQVRFRHSDIKNGAVLELKMGRKPSEWGQKVVPLPCLIINYKCAHPIHIIKGVRHSLLQLITE